MSLYVDNIVKCSKTKDYPYRTLCHLTADSAVELIDFVVSVLGLDTSCVKEKHNINYSIIPASLCKIAIAHGAVVVDKFIFLGD